MSPHSLRNDCAVDPEVQFRYQGLGHVGDRGLVSFTFRLLALELSVHVALALVRLDPDEGAGSYEEPCGRGDIRGFGSFVGGSFVGAIVGATSEFTIDATGDGLMLPNWSRGHVWWGIWDVGKDKLEM